MSEHWFRPKTHGYGASPVGWKGWAVISAFGLAQTMFALMMLWPDANLAMYPVRIAVWGALSAIGTLAFLRFCRARTDGEWRWRWGGKQ